MGIHGRINCPFCKASLRDLRPLRVCAQCHTSHHLSCWKEYGHCAVFGCSGVRWFREWNPLLFVPSMVLTLSMVDQEAAFILSPFFVQALLVVILEIFYFAYQIAGKTFSGRIASETELSKMVLYLMANLVPIGLRFGFHFFVR
jgi:hypothetical protein